jgi:hypothetical protein
MLVSARALLVAGSASAAVAARAVAAPYWRISGRDDALLSV